MQSETFIKHCQRLMEWFNKTLTTEQMNAMYRKISFIPAEAMEAITDHIIDDYKPTQGNFPTIKLIKELHRIWKFKNPDKYVNAPRTKCIDCLGIGYIWIEKVMGDFPYQVCYRCGSCLNWESDVSAETMPSIKRNDAIAKGLTIICPLLKTAKCTT